MTFAYIFRCSNPTGPDYYYFSLQHYRPPSVVPCRKLSCYWPSEKHLQSTLMHGVWLWSRLTKLFQYISGLDAIFKCQFWSSLFRKSLTGTMVKWDPSALGYYLYLQCGRGLLYYQILRLLIKSIINCYSDRTNTIETGVTGFTAGRHTWI